MIRWKRLAVVVGLVGVVLFTVGYVGRQVSIPEPLSSSSLVSIYGQSESGNGRPVVTNDGQMVRRRQAIAVHLSKSADPVRVRSLMDRQARKLHEPLTQAQDGVMSAALRLEVVTERGWLYLLDPTATQDDAIKFRRVPGVEHLHYVQVLVHDLKFVVRVSDPEFVSTAVRLEGILYDQLGSFTMRELPGVLEVGYTGQLLSDRQVLLARDGIARRAGVRISEVQALPRSGQGTGVDMSVEPPEEVVPVEVGHDHSH